MRMKIAICGSLTFHKEMRDVQASLEASGVSTIVPKSLSLIENEGYQKPRTVEERLTAEAKYDFIREHFKNIEDADAILVVNPQKDGIPGYIGGNTFLEMGYAFGLGKKVYLLSPVPEMDYKTEMFAIQPIVIDGDLQKIAA